MLPLERIMPFIVAITREMLRRLHATSVKRSISNFCLIDVAAHSRLKPHGSHSLVKSLASDSVPEKLQLQVFHTLFHTVDALHRSPSDGVTIL